MAAFIAKAVAVAVIALLSYEGLRERAANADLTTRTLEALAHLESVLSTLKDAETGQRGYLLTGDERYLEPYKAAISEIPNELLDLRPFTAASRVQAPRFERLESLLHQKLGELARSVELKQAGKPEVALAFIRTDVGKTTMDGIRDLVHQMENEEQATLQRSLEEGRASAGTVRHITSIGAALLLILILATAYTSTRAFRDREVQLWERAGHTLLSSRVQGDRDLEQLGDSIARFLAEYLDACVAAVHVAEPDGRFIRRGAFALAPAAANQPIRLGEGLLGQAAKEKRVLHLSDVPEDYLRVTSGLGAGKPRELLVVPALNEGETNAVIELGFFREVGTAERQLLERVSESVGLAVQSAKYRTRQAELLEETQRQAEELQAQQEELKTTNEELEEQTQTLESQKEDLLTTQRRMQGQATELGRANRYKSEFLANMSHELRTPLNSSLILAKLLIENKEGNLTLEQVKYAQSIYAAGNDLLALINDILDLSKIEAGKVDLTIEPVTIARIVEELKRRFVPLAAERKLELRVTVEGACPKQIETDSRRLQQILTNLLSNAVKFTETGSIHLRVAPNDTCHIAFMVEDTGIGIPIEQHDLIFEAFRQADGTTHRKFGGTGLGLSICRELVTLLGGKIRLHSTPGEGSAFTVLVPVRPQERVLGRSPDPRPPPMERPPAERPKVAKPSVEDDRDKLAVPGRVVLIVEDDPAFAQILRDLGRELSFQCVVAQDAAEGLALAREFRPVAVLLDIGLPDQSGLTVLELLKRDPSTRHVPIHIVSVHDCQKVARELGAVGYALKPVKREELVAAFRLIEDRLSRAVKGILVVEDDAVQRDAITKLLQADGVDILAVATADEALARLRGATYDCCVLDLMLPDVSGFELLERMANDDTCSFPPVIVYTARALTLEEEQRLRRSSSSIIIKGARSPERLLEEVTLFLHKVESELPAEQQRMLRTARDRERIFDGRSVLLVEDDVRSIFALTRALEPKGLSVQIARNGKEALARLAEGTPIDLVLMDVMMPEMDGLAATREIRKDGRWTTLPIIALTAKAMPDDREKCLAAGANDYSAKPIDVDKLLSLLRVWMPR